MNTSQTGDQGYTHSGSSPGVSLAERFCALFQGLSTSHGNYSIPEGTKPDSGGKLKGDALTATADAPTAALRAAAALWKNNPVKLWEKHLSGERSLGVVPICSDSSCVFGALDIDSYQGFDISLLLDKCKNLQLPLCLLRSKSGGCHAMLFSAAPVPAKLMRERLAECRDALNLPLTTEIFPKQSTVDENGKGSWLNCPYFGPARYSIMPWGTAQTSEEFLDFAEASKLEASFFEKPVAYMQAAGATTKKKKAKKEPPAYTNLEGGHYPQLQSSIAHYIGHNPSPPLTDAQINIKVLADLDTAGVTDPAKRREYTEEMNRFGRKMRNRGQEVHNRTYTLSHSGNAERFVDLYGDQFRYLVGAGWLSWNGKHWEPDNANSVQEAMKMIAETIKPPKDADEDSVKAVKGWARSSRNLGIISASIKLAASTPSLLVTREQLDTDPWLFNCANGTIDLRTGLPHDHDQADLITKMSPVRFDPLATSEAWDNFLKTSVDGDNLEFIQKAAGRSLTAITEKKFFMSYGPKNSGKTTFLEVMGAVMGTYAGTTDFATFMQHKFEQHPAAVAALDGPRFVAASEAPKNAKLDLAKLKRAVGGDKLSARLMNQNFYTFTPKFTLWLACNELPQTDAEDDAGQDRILCVEFPHEKKGDALDVDLKPLLMNTEISGPAILAWAVRGCAKWIADGKQMRATESVRQANEQQREENDDLKDFVDTYLVLGEGLEVSVDELYSTYTYWAEKQGDKYHTMNSSWLGRRLRRRRIESRVVTVNGESTRVYVGATLQIKGGQRLRTVEEEKAWNDICFRSTFWVAEQFRTYKEKAELDRKACEESTPILHDIIADQERTA